MIVILFIMHPFYRLSVYLFFTKREKESIGLASELWGGRDYLTHFRCGLGAADPHDPWRLLGRLLLLPVAV